MNTQNLITYGFAILVAIVIIVVGFVVIGSIIGWIYIIFDNVRDFLEDFAFVRKLEERHDNKKREKKIKQSALEWSKKEKERLIKQDDKYAAKARSEAVVSQSYHDVNNSMESHLLDDDQKDILDLYDNYDN